MSKIHLVLLKGTIFAAIVALVLTAFSATSVFAAKPTPTPSPNQASNLELKRNWKKDLASLKTVIANFKRYNRTLNRTIAGGKVLPGEVSRVQAAFQTYQSVLSKAKAIASSHSGFDANGTVTDQVQASKSIAVLSRYLDELHGPLLHTLINNKIFKK